MASSASCPALLIAAPASGQGKTTVTAALARLQALLLEHAPGPTLMSRDNLESLRVPNVASRKLPGLRDLGITPQGLALLAPHFQPADPRAR